jgi:hypothetical protein
VGGQVPSAWYGILTGLVLIGIFVVTAAVRGW